MAEQINISGMTTDDISRMKRLQETFGGNRADLQRRMMSALEAEVLADDACASPALADGHAAVDIKLREVMKLYDALCSQLTEAKNLARQEVRSEIKSAFDALEKAEAKLATSNAKIDELAPQAEATAAALAQAETAQAAQKAAEIERDAARSAEAKALAAIDAAKAEAAEALKARADTADEAKAAASELAACKAKAAAEVQAAKDAERKAEERAALAEQACEAARDAQA